MSGRVHVRNRHHPVPATHTMLSRECEPERDLWCAVLEQAAYDAHRNIERAREWWFSRAAESICDALCLDIDFVRRMIYTRWSERR